MNAVIYARVSSKEQAREGFSIPAQQKLLPGYAQEKGIKVVKEFVDIETAKSIGRTNFGEMIKFLQSSPTIKIILVEKTDRLYIKDWVTLDDLMDELELELHYVKENFILSSGSKSMEKFMHGIKVLMAKNYIDNLSDEIKKGMNEKVLQGGYPHKAPVGYINDPESRLVSVDPKTAPYIKRIFEMYATGNFSLKSLRKKCVKDGFSMQPSRPRIAVSSLEYILTNEFYTGFFTWKGRRYRGNHTPIISRELFEKVEEQLRRHNQPKDVKHDFTYSGLMTCAKCGCAITAEIKKNRYIYYHCTDFHENCKRVYVREEILDEQFKQIIKSLQFDEEVLEWIRMALKSSLEDEKKFHHGAIKELQAQYNLLQNRIEKIYLDKLDGRINEEFWQKNDTRWREEQEEILKKIKIHQKADRNYMLAGLTTLELAEGVFIVFYSITKSEKEIY